MASIAKACCSFVEFFAFMLVGFFCFIFPLYLQAQQPQPMRQLIQTRLTLPQLQQPSPLAGVLPARPQIPDASRPAQDDPATSEVASLHSGPGLRWQRVSPTAQQPDGPVLYTLIMRSSATANYVPKISANYSLTNSLIFDNGSSVSIGALSIAADGTISFKSGQTFPGTGPGTITGIFPGAGLAGGGFSGAVTLGLDATSSAILNSFGAPAGYNFNSPNGAANYCIVGQVLLFPFTPTGLPGLLPADGRLLAISQNTALFSIIGTFFGGDGRTTFGVPDLRAIAPKNMAYSICAFGVFP